MWLMVLSRARLVLSDGTTYHAAPAVSVARKISSRAREEAYQRAGY
jgi:hypothetical protein